MAEIPSDVFDILHPSPVSLKELSAMTVNLEVWRREVDKYRRNCKLEEFDPFKLKISSKTVYPDLPSAIYGAIDEYASKLGSSMDDWLMVHYDEGFHLHYSHQNDVLKDFDDFVCDYNGTIDYLKTAERMMRCDRFDVDKKFFVACIYFLEDDIRRFWPLVCEKIDLSLIDYFKSSLFYYWICRLKNELDKIPIDEHNESVDEEMLENCMSGNRRRVEYFWNRVPLDVKMQKAEDLMYRHEYIFTRYILPKLNDQQISQLINSKTENLLQAWLENVVDYEYDQILRLWMRYRNMINANSFEDALVKMLYTAPIRCRRRDIQDESNDESHIEMVNKKWAYLGSEMLNTAPDHLKRSTIREVLYNSGLFTGRHDWYTPYNVGILLAILFYATSKDRNKFWKRAWPKLIYHTRGENLQRIMELCFKTPDEISEFKRNVLAKSGVVKRHCVAYLRDNYFDEANDLVDFCFPDIQAARSYKQQILRSAFLNVQDTDPTSIEIGIFFNVQEFDDFIINAFDSVDQASVFKSDLILSPFFQHNLLKMMLPSYCNELMRFVDAFVSSEETLREIKIRVLEPVKLQYHLERSELPTEDRDTFLLWCLGSKEDVSEFERQFLSEDSE